MRTLRAVFSQLNAFSLNSCLTLIAFEFVKYRRRSYCSHRSIQQYQYAIKYYRLRPNNLKIDAFRGVNLVKIKRVLDLITFKYIREYECLYSQRIYYRNRAIVDGWAPVAYFYGINRIESTKDHRYDVTLLRSSQLDSGNTALRV